jgi:hypothetical protein
MAVEGRWTIRWDADSWPHAQFKIGGTFPLPGEEFVPVVPCDDAAVERGGKALVEIAKRWGLGDWQMSGARELAEALLRAAGETS